MTSTTRALRSFGATPLMRADEVEVLAYRHVGVERRRFRQIAGAALGLERVGEDVESGDDGLALRGGHVARQDAHRRCFSRAVRSQEPENFASFHPETDIVDGGHATVPFRDVLNLDHKPLQL